MQYSKPQYENCNRLGPKNKFWQLVSKICEEDVKDSPISLFEL